MVVEKAIADYTDFRIPGLVVTESGTLYFSRAFKEREGVSPRAFRQQF
jgi:hypothetical protein